MSKRVTGKWTETTAEAFGDNKKIQKGDLAERLYYNYAKNNYYKVVHYGAERDKQNSGIDFEIWTDESKDPDGVDCKGTIYQDGMFVVENKPTGWIRNQKKTNKYVVHLNVDDGRAIEYERESMIKYLDKLKIKDELAWLQYDDFEFGGESLPLVYRKFWII